MEPVGVTWQAHSNKTLQRKYLFVWNTKTLHPTSWTMESEYIWSNFATLRQTSLLAARNFSSDCRLQRENSQLLHQGQVAAANYHAKYEYWAHPQCAFESPSHNIFRYKNTLPYIAFDGKGASKKLQWERYFILKTRLTRELGSDISFQACLASITRLNSFNLRKSSPSSSLDWHNLSHSSNV